MITSEDVAKGFTNVEVHDPALEIPPVLTNNFTAALKGNTEEGINDFGTSWPAWGMYSDDWPVANSTLDNYWSSMGNASSNYPVLIWENRMDVKK